MRKVWVFKRNLRKGWYVGWYELGKRKTKALPNKALAEHYRQLKYAQLNSDVFTGIIDVDWKDLIDEYMQFKELQGLTESSIYEITLTLAHFEKLTSVKTSKLVTQAVADRFIKLRSKVVKRSTLNKDIRNLSAFLSWAKENRYTSGIKLKQLKTSQAKARILNSSQIRKLLNVAEPTVYVRILLALSTGLRRGDIEKLKKSDIDLENCYICSTNKKTGKSLSRPIPLSIVPVLQTLITSKQGENLFSDYFTSKKWNRARKKAGLNWLKFHDLRKTFASILLQRGESTSVVQTLLQHSTPNLTHSVYANVDPALKKAIAKIPVDDWLNP